MNFDGAFTSRIFRNPTGFKIMVFAGRIIATSAVEQELMALLEGLKLADKFQFHNLIIEGDCSTIMNNFKQGGTISWRLNREEQYHGGLCI